VSPSIHHGTTNAETNRMIRHNQCRDEQDGSSDAALSVMPEYLVSSSIVLKETDAILMISFPFESVYIIVGICNTLIDCVA
jgi:hypothetical protein